ncbi:MAG: GDP-L-fucose synthase [Sulfurimonas sp.]
MTKDSKIFVAGGAGLVGSAIIKNLQEKGYTNIVANYHSRPPMTNNQYTNTPITWEKLDLLDSNAVADFFEQEKPEFVFLAAAKVGGIVANNTYRADFIYENLQIQNNVIHQSYIHDVKKLMFLGSTCIYPKNCPQPMKGEYLLTSELEYTNEPYAIAKIAGIKMCESYNLQYGTNFISVMPTNLYGPNDNFDLEKSHVLPALIRKMHLGRLLENGDVEAVKKDMNGTRAVIGDLSLVISEESTDEELLKVLNYYGIKYTNTPVTNNQSTKPSVSIEIWGTGKPRREFLWSEDMADACVFLMENRNFQDIINSQTTNNQYTNTQITNNQSTSNEIRNTHINIGTGIDISIHDLAHMIKNIIGFSGELHFNTEKPDGTMVKLTDPSKLHSLGWKHKIELEDGIRTMYEWYKGN